MAPGIDGLPVAERDVDVSGPAANFLGSVSPRLLRRLRLGLRAFEWLPFPCRFSRDNSPADHLEAIAELSRDGGLTIAEGRPPIPVPVAKVVGGTTVINSGTCFRAPEPVLADWRDRFGISWAGDMAADYAEAE